MPEKKEGATTTCSKCETDLICRLKDYGANFAATLQWQNFDGTPHYKTTDGKNYSCNVPDEDELDVQSQITKPSLDESSTKEEIIILSNLNSKLEVILEKLERVREMVEPLFQKMVNEQIRKNAK